MSLQPWRRRGAAPVRTDVDDLWTSLRSLLASPFGAGLESHLPEVFGGTAFPPVDVSETETAFVVRAELPGLEEKDIEVHVAGDQLVISGERTWRDEGKDQRVHRVESQYGAFRRAVQLPAGLVTDADAVAATYAKGILTVTLRKSEPSKPRRISVEST